MADTIQTIRQIEDIFQMLTLQMLGLDPEAPGNQSRVRISWPENGAPAWKRAEDVVFLMISYDDDLISRQMEATYANAGPDLVSRSLSYTRVIRVNWIVYGPNSADDAEKIRSGLFSMDIFDALMAQNIALIVDVPLPVRTPELYNGQWWDRSTLYARFNEKVMRQQEIPNLLSADVRVVKG